ncbi:PaaI family thioesterase [Roseomonas sp. SSH11]|uniref:PaaI family thioesterase n=1 Tax=Pararoseomonas baculiformis TaxID=2820812 RepID=A0ABS4A953_9PROT|nr:PaaI family thioesterase [Pararoseomonas baculiformis]MBP0443525.1 PaaI family thioesterase [Pararoseomonas baculiformis]
MEDTAPFHDLLGITVDEWRDGFARLALVVERKHFNRSGVLHGGVLLALVDQAGAYAGMFCTVPGNVRRGVTLDLNTRFTGQVTEGRITAEGRVVTAGRNIFFTSTEVRGPDGKIVAYGSGTHRWRSGSQLPEGVPADSPLR